MGTTAQPLPGLEAAKVSLLGDQEGDPREESPERRGRFEGAVERPLRVVQNQRCSERQLEMWVWGLGARGGEGKQLQ